jgi:Asp-tRNA(Asn)/Glu-tRNA(Gln) amidotransferase A subunit family amidase
LDRGAILFSKTTTAEFAVHYIQAGKTLNPHNPQHITGTSSAGSAVAVASGALPICMGTQTGGSIVRPASFCGVFGFKPSFGAYDRTGTLKTTDTLDTIGLLGSDIYGIKKTFVSTFQKEPQYPGAKNYFDLPKRILARPRLRIGIVTDQFRGYRDYSREVRDDFDLTVSRLQHSGFEIQAPRAIDFINEVHPLQDRIYCKALSYYFQEESKRGVDLSPVMSEMIRLGQKITAEQYVQAVARQPMLRAQFDKVFETVDFLITPSTATAAPRIAQNSAHATDTGFVRQDEIDDTCLIWTFFGYPVLSLPTYWSESLGLPYGLQVVGPKFSDLALLDVSAVFLDSIGS